MGKSISFPFYYDPYVFLNDRHYLWYSPELTQEKNIPALYVTLCACSKSELGGGNVRKPQKYTYSQLGLQVKVAILFLSQDFKWRREMEVAKKRSYNCNLYWILLFGEDKMKRDNFDSNSKNTIRDGGSTAL